MLFRTKAFDRVEWYWIDKCLEKFNFVDNFRKWTQMMLKGSKTALKTNVFLSEYFQISRSIKQGCPSAPLLYIIQAEAMAASIILDPNIKGINIPLHDNVFRESRLSQFVDDTHN